MTELHHECSPFLESVPMFDRLHLLVYEDRRMVFREFHWSNDRRFCTWEALYYHSRIALL